MEGRMSQNGHKQGDHNAKNQMSNSFYDEEIYQSKIEYGVPKVSEHDDNRSIEPQEIDERKSNLSEQIFSYQGRPKIVDEKERAHSLSQTRLGKGSKSSQQSNSNALNKQQS